MRVNEMPWTVGNRIVGFDPQRVRVWVAGQRLHHGATGVCLAGAAAARLISRRQSARPVAWLVAGGAMVAHDWKDRSVWFAPGTQEPQHPSRLRHNPVSPQGEARGDAGYVVTD